MRQAPLASPYTQVHSRPAHVVLCATGHTLALATMKYWRDAYKGTLGYLRARLCFLVSEPAYPHHVGRLPPRFSMGQL